MQYFSQIIHFICISQIKKSSVRLKKGWWWARIMYPRLVILSRGPRLYSTRRLAEEAQKAGWAVRIIDPLSLTVVVDEKGGRIFHRGWPIECEAVIPRIGYSITRRGVAIVRQFEQMGVIVLNQSLSIEQSRDKLLASQVMADAGVPIPVTAHVASTTDIDSALARVGGVPCVVKATEGTQGSGVFLADNYHQVRQLVSQMLERGMKPLVQTYVEESHGKDIRVLVVGGKVAAAMRRRASGSEFRSNFHLGGSVERVKLSDDFVNVALAAANILGMDIAGVDLLESRDGPLVLEVNSSPGLEGIEGASGVNVAGAVAQHLNERLQAYENQKTQEADIVISKQNKSSLTSE